MMKKCYIIAIFPISDAGMLLCFRTGTTAPVLYATLLPACFKAESNFHHCLVLHAQGNTAEPYISLPMTIQDYLTYRQETVNHGKRNI